MKQRCACDAAVTPMQLTTHTAIPAAAHQQQQPSITAATSMQEHNKKAEQQQTPSLTAAAAAEVCSAGSACSTVLPGCYMPCAWQIHLAACNSPRQLAAAPAAAPAYPASSSYCFHNVRT